MLSLLYADNVGCMSEVQDDRRVTYSPLSVWSLLTGQRSDVITKKMIQCAGQPHVPPVALAYSPSKDVNNVMALSRMRINSRKILPLSLTAACKSVRDFRWQLKNSKVQMRSADRK